MRDQQEKAAAYATGMTITEPLTLVEVFTLRIAVNLTRLELKVYTYNEPAIRQYERSDSSANVHCGPLRFGMGIMFIRLRRLVSAHPGVRLDAATSEHSPTTHPTRSEVSFRILYF
jgi:hypothetical protein